MQRHTYTINFQCKAAKKGKDGTAPIYAVITIDGKAALIQLPKRCKPEDFQRLKKAQRENQVKQFCDAVRAKIDSIHTNLSITGDTVTSARIKDVYLNGHTKTSHTLEELKNEFRKQKARDEVSTYTWGKYELALNDFLELTGHTLSDEVSSVTHADILKYESLLRQTQADMTVCKKLKNMKAFFTHGIALEYITKNPFLGKKIGAGEVDTPTEYLTYEEIQKVKALDLRSDRLCRARDMFLWQCFTGQNIGDMKIMKAEDVQLNEKGQYFIKKARKKSGKHNQKYEYISILFEDAIDIWKDYKGRLPYIEGQHYNENIADLMKMAGIDKHITSKSGRTTYACYLFNHLGLRNWSLLGKMLGHSNERQTREYCKIFDTTLFDEVESKAAELNKKNKAIVQSLQWIIGTDDGLKIRYPK